MKLRKLIVRYGSCSRPRVLLLGSGSPAKKRAGTTRGNSVCSEGSCSQETQVECGWRARISAALKKRWVERRKTGEAVKKAVPAKAVTAKKVVAKKSAKEGYGPCHHYQGLGSINMQEERPLWGPLSSLLGRAR
jgi:hypothetical protein